MPNDGDLINVSVERLRETASAFQKASQDTMDLVNNMDSVAEQLINDMNTAAVLHSTAALDRLCHSWHTAIIDLSSVLEEVAKNLYIAADNYQNADKNGMPSQ